MLRLQRAHRGRRLEGAVERSLAHSGDLGERFDAQHLAIMAAHPADRTAYLCETAVFLRDLAELRPERPLHQAIENSALAKRRMHPDFVGLAEQRKHHRPGPAHRKEVSKGKSES